MARLERLLCVLVLVLCGAPSPGLCVPLASTSKKPIIGKKAGREPRACGRVSVLGTPRCWVPSVAPRLRNTAARVTMCAFICSTSKSRAKTPFRSCRNIANAWWFPQIHLTLEVGREEGAPGRILRIVSFFGHSYEFLRTHQTLYIHYVY